jgi:hypothetical protein
MVKEKCYNRDGNIKAFNAEWDKYCSEENKTRDVQKLDKEIKSDNKPTYKKDKQYSKSMLNRMKSLKNKIVRNPARQKKVESGN